MKSLVFLGIYLLVVFGEVESTSEEDKNYCCRKKNVPASMSNDTCVTLKELVENKAQEFKEQIKSTSANDTEISPILELQIKINSVSQAALECVPNNRVYTNTHVILDTLHSIIANFPTPQNVLNHIKETQDYMDTHFDALRAGLNTTGCEMPSNVRSRFDEFYKKYVKKAVEVFEYHNNKAKDNTKVFEDNPFVQLIDQLGDKMDHCLGISPTAFESIFNCRQDVRTVAEELNSKMEELRPKLRITSSAPHQSIELLIKNYTSEEKEVLWIILNEKAKQNHCMVG